MNENQKNKKFEPKNRYDYQKIMAGIINKPIGFIFKTTEGWPNNWFIDIQSNCKEKTKEQQAKFIWWFIKKSKN